MRIIKTSLICCALLLVLGQVIQAQEPPKTPTDYVREGVEAIKAGKPEEALAAYRKSLELKPTFTYSLFGLGFVLMKQGKYEEAIEPLRKGLEIEPKNTDGNWALGMVYANLGNKTGAMQQYYLLETLSPRLAADLLRAVPR